MRYFTFLWFTAFIFTACSSDQSLEVELMTYNIRLDSAGDGEDNWHQRKVELSKYVNSNAPDFLGVQEALPNQMDFLAEHLSDYKYIGVGRDDGKRAGEFSAIFYKKADWEVKDSGTFWLSESPQAPSLGWDANIKRVCSYGIFEHASGKTFAVFNTHFDHQGKLARAGSVDLLSERVPVLADNHPFVVMGDFNFSPDDPLYSQVTTSFEDSFTPGSTSESGTFNGFRLNEKFDRRIDYIFIDKEKVNVASFNIDQPKTKTGRQLSDHFPVMAKVKI
jgi:endonuclease/exonuclease/phosphatase family metal-dependent hydrolase